MYIDTHFHLADDKLTDKTAVVSGYLRDGVIKTINVGCCLSSSERAVLYADEFESVYFTVGFHPSDAKDFDENAYNRLKELSNHPKCVGIGEIGLDYYWDKSYNQIQKKVFIDQIRLADEVGLPICVHSRDAMGDTLQILKDHTPKYGGVMHCYAGSYESAKELLKLGFYFSFGGTLTFKNARNIPEVMCKLPLDRILTETDSPFLSPEPFRGRVNEPKNIPVITAKIAEFRGLLIEETAKAVMDNAYRLFPKLK